MQIRSLVRRAESDLKKLSGPRRRRQIKIMEKLLQRTPMQVAGIVAHRSRRRRRILIFSVERVVPISSLGRSVVAKESNASV